MTGPQLGEPGDVAPGDVAPGARRPVVVLGVGNVLLGDDGVGPAMIDALARDGGLPAGTVLVDGGTRGLALLPEVEAAGALVLLDAVDLGPDRPPGTLHVLEGDRIGDVYQPRATAHQVGISDLIAVARFARALPDHVVLVGLQPADVSTRIGLSPHVATALPAALAEVRRQCHRARDGRGPVVVSTSSPPGLRTGS